MAYAFTKGDTMSSTRTISKPSVGHKGNSMKGMPGHIKAGQTTSAGGMKGTSSIGPKREGAIGSKGGQSVKAHFTAAKSPGNATKSYKAASTGSVGKITGGKMESMKGRAKFSSER